MNRDLRERILAYNKVQAARREQAEDLMVLVAKLMELPYGQLKKVLTEDVLELLEKYGITEERTEEL